MERTIHLFSNAVYLISSSSVARNPLFYNSSLCNRFIHKLDKYLSPVCEILHYSILNREFQILVRIHNRETIEQKYNDRLPKFQNESGEVPLTTFIFSKAMSDLLVSTAKHFNYHHKRKGSVFSSRFKRKLIESEGDFNIVVRALQNMELIHTQSEEWSKISKSFRIRMRRKRLRKLKVRCALYYYRKQEESHEILSTFRLYNKGDLRGCFKNIPPKSIYKYFYRQVSIQFIPKEGYFP